VNDKTAMRFRGHFEAVRRAIGRNDVPCCPRVECLPSPDINVIFTAGPVVR